MSDDWPDEMYLVVKPRRMVAMGDNVGAFILMAYDDRKVAEERAGDKYDVVVMEVDE